MKRTISLTAVALILSSLTAYAAFSTDVFQPQQTYSGVNATSSTVTAQTLQAQDVVGYSTIVFTPNTGSLTLTLPASSTLSAWLPQPGLRLSMFLFDASSTSGINIGILGNTANGSVLALSSSTATTTSLKGMFLDVMREPGGASTTQGNLLWTLVPAI